MTLNRGSTVFYLFPFSKVLQDEQKQKLKAWIDLKSIQFTLIAFVTPPIAKIIFQWGQVKT